MSPRPLFFVFTSDCMAFGGHFFNITMWRRPGL